ALRHARAVGKGVGPVIARPGFTLEPSLLPQLSIGSLPPARWASPTRGRDPGVYAIVDSAERVEAVLGTSPTVNTIQLRMKQPDSMTDRAWAEHLREQVQRSGRAANATGTTLVINDHWQVALAAGARALHLGQEDLMALTPAEREHLQAARDTGVQL